MILSDFIISDMNKCFYRIYLCYCLYLFLLYVFVVERKGESDVMFTGGIICCYIYDYVYTVVVSGKVGRYG